MSDPLDLDSTDRGRDWIRRPRRLRAIATQGGAAVLVEVGDGFGRVYERTVAALVLNSRIESNGSVRRGGRPARRIALTAGAVFCGGLLLAAGASPAPSRSLPPPKVGKPFRIQVPVPPPGDINLTVVTLRGKLPRTTLANLRRLPSTVGALAATRTLGKGTSQLWLGVLNRGPGSSAGTGGRDGFARFIVSGPFRIRTTTFRDLTIWPAAPPGICKRGNTPLRSRELARPQFFHPGTNKLFRDAVERILRDVTVDTLCDHPLDPSRAAELGIPHSDFTMRLNSPTEVGVTGTISVASKAFVLTPVPAGIVQLGGKDGRSCQLGSRGAEQFVICGGNRPADQPIDLTMTYEVALEPDGVVRLRAVVSSPFDMNGRQFGPDSVGGP